MPASDVSISILLKAATPDLYRRNAFRLTGLPVTASIREVARQADKLKMLAELGGQAAQHFALVPGMKPPTPEEVREATQRLKDVEARALDEFFWFWPDDWEKPESDEAYAAVKRNDLEAAFAIWQQRETENKSSIASRNLALVFHMRALEWAHLDFAEPLPKDRVVKVASYWKNAFDRWEWLADDERLWDAFKARIRQVDDPVLTTGFARRLRSELPQAFDKINAELALTYAENGRRSEAQWHVDFLKSTHAGADDAESTIDVVLGPSRARLERAIESAHAASQSEKKSGISQAKKLLDATEPLLAVFDMFHESDSMERCQLFDEVAACALDCAVSGYNIGNASLQNAPPPSTRGLDPRKTLADSFVAVLIRAESLATDLDLRQRISQNIQTAEGNLNFSTKIKPLLDKLAAIQKLTTTAPSERLNRVKDEVVPMLNALFQPGVLEPEAQQTIGNSIAIVLRGIALAANNDFRQPVVGMEALVLAIKFARDPELITRLRQDSQAMRQNMAASNVQTGAGASGSNSGQGCVWIGIGGFVLLAIIGMFDGKSKSKPATYTPSRPTASTSRSEYTPTPAYTPSPTYTPSPRYTPPAPIKNLALEPPKVVANLEAWQLAPDVWHSLRNKENKEISAKIVSFDGTNVILTTSSDTYTYPLSGLSEESQRRVRDLDILRRRPVRPAASRPILLPLTGVYREPGFSTTSGPLTIRTRAGSGNYYVKLVAPSSGQTRMVIFIRDGETASDLVVPSGTYEMRYASGDKWYGDDLLFGPETLYNKADSHFTFGDGDGYTVELYKQLNGNLSTSPVNRDNF